MDRPANYFRFSDIERAYHPGSTNPLDQELWRRANLNAEAWVHPDERVASPYWYLHINQRRRYRASEQPLRKMMLNFTLEKSVGNDWYKNWFGTEQYYEAIAKGEKLEFVIPPLDVPGADVIKLTPRERLDAYLNIKIQAMRPLIDLDRVARFRTIDSLARTPNRTFPHLPYSEISWERATRAKLHPAWWMPRVLGWIRYKILGGRMPQTMFFDRDQEILWREHRLEGRKYHRHQLKLNDAHPVTAIRYVRIPPDAPNFVIRLLPTYHRFYRNFIESIQYPQWRTAIKSWGVKAPLAAIVTVGLWRHVQNGSRSITDDIDLEELSAHRRAAQRAAQNLPISEERKEKMMEIKYPRNI